MGTTAKSPEIGARYYRVYVLNSDGTRFKTLDKVYRKSAQAAANKAARIVAANDRNITAEALLCRVYCMPSGRHSGLYYGKTGIKNKEKWIMAKKKEKKGFTPELHELFDTLYAKLREYGQCCAFIAICDNKNEITKRIGIIDEVTHQEEGGVVLPDIAIANAMGGDSPQDIAGRHLVYNAVLSYLHEYPDEIPDFLMNFQEMVKDIREEMDDNDTPEVEIPIVINSNNNPNGDC